MAVQTQWRVADMGGRTGLDYAGVQACLEMREIKRKDRAGFFAGLQVMERAALDEWAKQR